MRKIKKSAMMKVDEPIRSSDVEMVPVLFTAQKNPARNGVYYIPAVALNSLMESYRAVTLPDEQAA